MGKYDKRMPCKVVFNGSKYSEVWHYGEIEDIAEGSLIKVSLNGKITSVFVTSCRYFTDGWVFLEVSERRKHPFTGDEFKNVVLELREYKKEIYCNKPTSNK